MGGGGGGGGGEEGGMEVCKGRGRKRTNEREKNAGLKVVKKRKEKPRSGLEGVGLKQTPPPPPTRLGSDRKRNVEGGGWRTRYRGWNPKATPTMKTVRAP